MTAQTARSGELMIRPEFHKKVDGTLMICHDGRMRYLTLIEELAYRFGFIPKDAIERHEKN